MKRRPDVTEREQLRRFLKWRSGKQSQSEFSTGTGRSFRDATAWCWALEPLLPVTGEVHDVILVDGVWIGSWCLLIAQSAAGTVIDWQWCARESAAAWEALFTNIPEPVVVVTDGGSGIRSALARTWPNATIQRCIFPIQLNVTRELTRKPRIQAGRKLRQLSITLGTTRTTDDAITWRLTLEAWWHKHGHLTRERTMFRNGQFGYTHDRLRKAWNILHRATQTGHIFTFLKHDNPRTTSRLEGLNSQIRHMLRHHRGMPIEHRRRAVEWFLFLQEIPLDNALDPSEGLWLRAGWAGRG